MIISINLYSDFVNCEFQYRQRPPTILLDCSKLQLGRGRIDDTVSSFRRRLELFREQTLPMLKTMDSSNRLQIVSIVGRLTNVGYINYLLFTGRRRHG